MSDTPRVLVTGGAGYIGSHAVLALLDAGYRVSVADNLVTGFRWAVPDAAAFHEVDIGDTEAMVDILQQDDIGAIMHFAGSVVVPESVENPLKYYGNNTAATRSLIEAAVTAKVPHFIFSSTAATYGIPKESPVREDTPQIPINPYGMSKLMSEAMLHDTAAAHDFAFVALRYFNVAGADPDGRAGQATKGATHLIKVASEAATGKRSHVDVYGTDYDTPDGTGIRDYIHVTDLAAAHVLALDWLRENKGESTIMNAGYKRGFSVLEVLDSVERVSGNRIVRNMAPRRAGDPDALISDNTKILATLGWQPQHADLDKIVKHALDWEAQLHMRQN
ncbi:UDP-glucose 4-epimerase GalE [Pacificimonas sp. WHA3]|uniref:UDP-glucose 4-epimerase n=1 Tax=Pacificimonas pallii TaxID=2827236 RepID=A0ABS6SAU5_9SPHN|nr:UDP-glucose 4-epimerase GalE [Pacificimonas pallii]MBV7255522.1 UDP-glucose 4-epimerase GalE [Pacificimonas pallii]